MSDMKCPICNTNLEVLVGGANAVLGCPRCRYKATDGVWQELIRTRKAVDLALGWLEQVATPAKCDDDLCREFTKRKIDEIKQLIKGE